ncbi:MAG: hypothetical protein D3907_10350 [Candidatus Electrothrix sp. AUS3]|nr:hypothetical protein [Candidatus Electrothrix gigas]
MDTKLNKITRSEDEQKKADEMFNDLRDELLKRDLSNTENYDKTILTLSSAALGLSLTAIKLIVSFNGAEHIWLIKFGWIFLLLTIVATLLAYLIGNKAIAIQLDNARDYYLKGVEDAFNRKHILITVNTILNRATGLMFIAAISAIVAFVIINIDQGNDKMSRKNANVTTAKVVTVKKSANIPTMQQVPTTGGNPQDSANVPTMEQAPGTQTTSQGGSTGGTESSSSSNDSGDSK